MSLATFDTLAQLPARMLIEALTPIINHREDQIMLINLGPADGRAQTSFETLGRALASGPDRVAVIV
jgi:hypothetical protein